MLRVVAKSRGRITAYYMTDGAEFGITPHPDGSGRWLVHCCAQPPYAFQYKELPSRRECIGWIESIALARMA